MRRVAIGIRLRDARGAQAEVHLLEGLLVHGDAGLGHRRARVGEVRRTAERAEVPGCRVGEMLVAQASRAADEHPVRTVANLEEIQEVRAREARHARRRPRDRARERVPGPEGEVEELVDVVVRRVLRLGYLLDDDATLALDLLLGEARAR